MLLLTTTALGATLAVGPGRPLPTIASALAVSSHGDEIVVDPGTYAEDLTIATEVVIRGAGQGVTILTSAGGDEVVAIDRDVRLESLTIDAAGKRGVVHRTLNTVDRIQLVDVEIHSAVSVLGSFADPSAVDVGQASLLIEDCWIHDNLSEGAAVMAHGSARIFRSVFEDNHTTNYPFFGAGAVYLWSIDGEWVQVLDNVFRGNSTTMDGGALTLLTSRQMAAKDRIAGNVFVGNHADGAGGAVFVGGDVTFGEVVYVNLVDNLFVGNDADIGGALAVEGMVFVVGYPYYVPGWLQVRLSRSTFVDNAARQGAHVYGGAYAELEALNLLLAHGKEAEGYHQAGAGSQDHFLMWGNVADGDGPGWAPGPGSVVADPLFAAFSDDGDPDNDDLTLLPGSPAIDAGSPSCANDVDGSASDIGVLP